MNSFFEKLTKSYREKGEKLPREKLQKNKKKVVHFKERELTNMEDKEPEYSEEETTEETAVSSSQETQKEEGPTEEGQLTIDVYQTDSEIVIKSTIAGVEPQNLDINITNDMVTIKGRREHDEKIRKENYFYQECYWGAFSRSIILPQDIVAEKAEAAMKNGVLTIRLPKAHVITSKKLRVKTG